MLLWVIRASPDEYNLKMVWRAQAGIDGRDRHSCSTTSPSILVRSIGVSLIAPTKNCTFLLQEGVIGAIDDRVQNAWQWAR